MECGVCWHVYDPAEGDPVWQISPGTAFADLPEDWRCPNCDAPQSKFLRLGGRHERRGVAPAGGTRSRRAAGGAFPGRHGGAMADVPICNPALAVASVGFANGADRRWGSSSRPGS